MGEFFVGLDLGQSSDPSALAVIERSEAAPAAGPTAPSSPPPSSVLSPGTRPRAALPAPAPLPAGGRLDVRHLHRYPLGTPYPVIVEDVAALMARPELASPGGRPRLVVDATGVGRPVADLFLRARMAAIVNPLTITGGDAWRRDGGSFWVAKKLLVSTVQAALQTGRLKVVPGLELAELLKKELINFQVKISLDANEQFGAWREGQHDDLVLAVALGVWMAENGRQVGIPMVHTPPPPRPFPGQVHFPPGPVRSSHGSRSGPPSGWGWPRR